MSESVARRLRHRADSRTLLPSLRGWMGSERIQRASERIWEFELSEWTPVPVRVSVAPTLSAFGETVKKTAFGDQRIVALVFLLQTTIITNVRL